MDLSVKKVGFGEKNYPLALKNIPDPPETLYYLGNLPTDDEIMISIVGTRKATAEGRLLAKQIAKELSERGITIVSGLAFGIDEAAHEGALKAGGRTIAVLATGLDNISPKSNENLGRALLKNNGAIISEYPEGAQVFRHQFLERNRIVSGLSIATIIVEAPLRSGSLVTAKHALDQGREVFVVPGPISHTNYQGSHYLLRNGARLVTSAEDILEDLGLADKKKAVPEEVSGKDDSNILKILRASGTGLIVDKISELTKLEPYIVYEELTRLQIQGLIEESNGKFSLKQ